MTVMVDGTGFHLDGDSHRSGESDLNFDSIRWNASLFK